MTNSNVIRPFSNIFLSQFLFAPEQLPFTNDEIMEFDQTLSTYEQIFLNPDIERTLISKNELLASFAISKAEASQLTMKEAQDVYALLVENSQYDFIGKKLREKKKLTQKDHDQLEFFNIAKTFRMFSQKNMVIEDITPSFIQEIHRQVTQGMDIFKNHLSDFTIYKSGLWRDNDDIRVGAYIPAHFGDIQNGVDELLLYLKKNQTPTGIAVFHTGLYGLHPFNNGNKRVCRILEHMLFRSIGLNEKNLYSTSYYYHIEKTRYYKYLLFSLERKNLNHFVSFMLESLVFSIVSVLKTSIEVKRNEFFQKQQIEGVGKTVLKPLLKRKELQFKHLAKYASGKVARQTLVTTLQSAVSQGILIRRESGKTTYYRLNLSLPEEQTLEQWLQTIRERLSYIPDDIALA